MGQFHLFIMSLLSQRLYHSATEPLTFTIVFWVVLGIVQLPNA